MMQELTNQLKEAYLQCEREVLGVHPQEVEVRVIKNHIVIIAKGTPTIEQSISVHAIRGRSIHQTICEMDRERLQALLKPKVASIVGCDVTSIQSDICIGTGEKMELIHLDCDIENKFMHD
ncbi:Na-translocating system protein MpsC family protein [Paenibacillus sp. FSL H7-0716]|nr:Na-translocating system protein MpsC family protein [Paenibacillus odorifer]